MQATITFQESELTPAVLAEIRQFLNGRRAKIIVEVLPSAASAASAPVVVQYVLPPADPARLAEIVAFYKNFQVDMTDFRFNREEANER